jgi:hypothetical protein
LVSHHFQRKTNKKIKIVEKLSISFSFGLFSFRMTQIQKMLDKLPDLRYDKCMKSIVSETKAFRWYILFVIVIKYIT